MNCVMSFRLFGTIKAKFGTTAGRPLYATHAAPGTLVKNGNGFCFEIMTADSNSESVVRQVLH